MATTGLVVTSTLCTRHSKAQHHNLFHLSAGDLGPFHIGTLQPGCTFEVCNVDSQARLNPVHLKQLQRWFWPSYNAVRGVSKWRNEENLVEHTRGKNSKAWSEKTIQIHQLGSKSSAKKIWRWFWQLSIASKRSRAISFSWYHIKAFICLLEALVLAAAAAILCCFCCIQT